MSLLDELKLQAEQLQGRDDQRALEARREVLYQESLKPSLHSILNYLIDLTEQLNIVDPEIMHAYSLPGIGDIPKLRQGGYVLKADSTDQTRQIRLRFHCVADDEREFAVRPKKQAAETREFLESQKMRYAEWPIRDSQQQIVGINFQLRIQVEVNFLFQVDLEQAGIKMVTANFHQFEVERNLIKPERINDQWLDHLGNYILRRHEKLHNLEIDENDKQLIRERLEKETRIRQQELELATQREKAELDEQRRNSLLGRLKSRIAKR